MLILVIIYFFDYSGILAAQSLQTVHPLLKMTSLPSSCFKSLILFEVTVGKV